MTARTNVCVCVCIYVYMYVCMYVCAYVRMNVCKAKYFYFPSPPLQLLLVPTLVFNSYRNCFPEVKAAEVRS